eukprot:1942186-Prymnesium_polylepis.1
MPTGRGRREAALRTPTARGHRARLPRARARAHLTGHGGRTCDEAQPRCSIACCGAEYHQLAQ